MKATILLAAIVLLTGCAPTVWLKPGGNQAQFDQDKADCMFRSNAATASDPNEFAPLYAAQVLFPQCMQAKGYAAKR